VSSAIKVTNMSYKYSQQINTNYNKIKKTNNIHMLPPIYTDQDRPMTTYNKLPHNREKTINTRKRMATSVHLSRGAIPRYEQHGGQEGHELDILGNEYGKQVQNGNYIKKSVDHMVQQPLMQVKIDPIIKQAFNNSKINVKINNKSNTKTNLMTKSDHDIYRTDSIHIKD